MHKTINEIAIQSAMNNFRNGCIDAINLCLSGLRPRSRVSLRLGSSVSERRCYVIIAFSRERKRGHGASAQAGEARLRPDCQVQSIANCDVTGDRQPATKFLAYALGYQSQSAFKLFFTLATVDQSTNAFGIHDGNQWKWYWSWLPNSFCSMRQYHRYWTYCLALVGSLDRRVLG